MAVTDDFNRADGGLGANWTSSRFVSNPPLIASNKAVGGFALGGISSAIYTGSAFTNDQYSKAVIATIGAGDPSVWVRAESPGNAVTGYYAEFTSGSQVQIFKSTATSLASTAISVLIAGDVIELRVIGTTLSAYLNGALLVQTTDSDHASGSPGFQLDITATSIDSWEGGNLSVTNNYLPRR
jgi:hypothetical protein